MLDRSTALLRTAVLLVGDVGHAEDILQTALMRLASRWTSVHTAPEAFIRQVLVNLAREAVVLRYFAGMSVAETAEALRTSEGTVKAHTSRAVARLRELLGEQITENAHGV